MRLHFCYPILFFALFVTSGIISDSALAQSNYKQKQFEPFLTRGKTTWSVSAGLRNNKTDFSAASDLTGTATPNVRLQQTFRDVSFIEFKGGVRHEEPADIAFIKGDVMAEAEIRGGVIVDGFAQRSGYAGDDRTAETFRQYSNTLNGDAIGGNLAVGYKFHLTGTPGGKAQRISNARPAKTARGQMRQHRAMYKALDKGGPYISLMPIAGYTIDQQSYKIDETFETFPAFITFPSETLYVTNWYGPFIGLEGEIKNQKHMLRLRGELYDLTYDAELTDEGNNLDYTHEADGEGYKLSAEYAYAMGDDYALTLEGYYLKRATDEGTEDAILQGVTVPTVKLYEIDDESNALRIGLRYNWN